MSTKQPTDYKGIIKDDDSLGKFLESMAEFDRCFCDAMASGDDFTISVEIHGNKGRLIHIRPRSERFKRPNGKDKQ